MLVMRLGSADEFVESRPMANVTSVTYTSFALYLVIALFLFVIAAAAYLLIDDYVDAKKNGKLTIGQRIVRFFRDYKSEVKKIVWPGFKDVMKNTLIVLIMCLLIGILIWVIDFGLGQLLNLVLGV